MDAYLFLIVLLGMAFVGCTGVAAAQWPPLTPRGRSFFALAGLLGLATGAHWLWWMAAPHPSPLDWLVERLLATEGNLLVWMAALFAATGGASCLWAVFGPEHRETEEE